MSLDASRTFWESRGKDLAAALLIFCLALFLLHVGDQERFHIDEAHKISETYYYHLFFVKGNLSHPDWRNDFYARTNPPIGKYLLGGLLALGGYQTPDRSLQNHFEELWQDPHQLKQFVPVGELAAARLITSLFAAGCCVAVYVIARSVGGIAAGLIAALLLMLHPLFLQYCSLALTDALLLFFLSVMVPVLIRTLRQITALSRGWSWSASRSPGDVRATTTGASLRISPGHPTDSQPRPISLTELLPRLAIASAVILCAAGTKLNGGLSGVLWLVGIGAGGLVCGACKGLRGRIAVFVAALAPPLLALGLFIVLNPSLYDHPVSSMISLRQAYQDWMLKQAIDPGDALVSLGQKWAEIYFHATILFEQRIVSCSPTFPFSWLLLLSALGAGSLAVQLGAGWWKKRSDPGALAVGLWLIIYGVGIIGWIPVDWDRYFLPLVPLMAVLAALGVCRLGDCLRTLFALAFKTTRDADAMRGIKIGGLLTGLSLLLALATAAVTDFSLISPTTRLHRGLPQQQFRNSYVIGARNYPNDPVRLMHLADYLDRTGNATAALPYAERALALSAKEPRSLLQEALLARRQLILSRILFHDQQYASAADVLSNNSASIADMISRLPSRDPQVQDEFRKLAAHSAELSKSIRNEHPKNRPRRS